LIKRDNYGEPRLIVVGSAAAHHHPDDDVGIIGKIQFFKVPYD
jgi:hypothetical protein